jgi:chemotaxis protein CheY-P-specific phosphatase CheC
MSESSEQILNNTFQLSLEAGTYSDVDITHIYVITADTTDADVIVQSFVNGMEGQSIFLMRKTGANNLIIEHQAGVGTQQIYNQATIDKTISTKATACYIYDGTEFVEH